MLSQAEAVKTITVVSCEFLNKLNMRRNLSLSLNLKFQCWEVCTVSLEINLENVNFHWKN